jgi:cytochrome c5
VKKPLDEHTDAAFFTRFGLVIGLLVFATGIFGAIAHALQGKYMEPDAAITHAEVFKRTEPVSRVITSNEQLALATPQPAANAAPKSGEEVVQQVCGACHTPGLLGAPKVHDHAAWQARMQQSGGKLENLVATAAKGKGQMPPRGGQPQLSDEELKKAIEAMM